MTKGTVVLLSLTGTSMSTASDFMDIAKLSKLFSTVNVVVNATGCRVMTFEAATCSSAASAASKYEGTGLLSSTLRLLSPSWRHNVIHHSVSPYSSKCIVVLNSAKCTLHVSSRISGTIC